MHGRSEMPAREINLQAHGWNCLLSVLDPPACVFLTTCTQPLWSKGKKSCSNGSKDCRKDGSNGKDASVLHRSSKVVKKLKGHRWWVLRNFVLDQSLIVNDAEEVCENQQSW